MSKPNVFIGDDKMLNVIIKSLHLNISIEDQDFLVCELYRHIDHTRKTSYRNGYQQGKFDEKMSQYDIYKNVGKNPQYDAD